MRALLVTRPDAREKPGGDVAVVDRTAEALRASGVVADVTATAEPDARGYDVAHVFGIFEPEFARPQLAALRATSTPVVLSPIWWDRTAFFVMMPHVARALHEREAARACRRIARLRDDEERLCRRPGRGALRRRDEQGALLRACDVAVPASEIEAFACATTLHAASVPYVVARYGAGDAPVRARATDGARAGVVCVGRIEPLKNQALLLLALRDLDVDVTLVGRCFDREYLALCRRWATPRTRFVEHVPREGLDALLASAAVHALPSWGDLPGFASVEAALAGARVVAGTRGCEREYLGPDAEYVDALDVDGIRDAVARALAAPPRAAGDALERRLSALTWERTAAATRDAYARALATRG